MAEATCMPSFILIHQPFGYSTPTSQTGKDKPVGFYGPIAPPGPNAPSSECPPNTCHVISCQRRRAVPLRPIWTIMVAAKLYQSRALVTKCGQNRLTLKGRSAGQRHIDRQTDSQTNSADNNGLSGLQSGQQTRRSQHFTPFPSYMYYV